MAKEVLNIIPSTSRLIAQHFDLNESFNFDDEINLKKQLIPIIKELLDNDFERLLNIFYRLDINEEKMKSELTADDVAQNLAGLIKEREKQKVITRIKYQG